MEVLSGYLLPAALLVASGGLQILLGSPLSSTPPPSCDYKAKPPPFALLLTGSWNAESMYVSLSASLSDGLSIMSHHIMLDVDTWLNSKYPHVIGK